MPEEPDGEGDDFGAGDGGEGMPEEPDAGEGEEEGEGRPSPDRFATDGPAPRLDKQELFSTFKETHAQGREIENRFRALKDELKAAKGRVGQLVQEVNKRKRVIDDAEQGLKQVTAQKRGSGASDIIDNDEWEAQKKLRDAKKDYRTQFDLHAEQKRIVQDIEGQIAQSKVDLVTQFEHWYQMQYGAMPGMTGDAHDGALHDLQDTGEQFDSMEHDRLEKIHPDGAVPFFKARKEHRTHHSHT